MNNAIDKLQYGNLKKEGTLFISHQYKFIHTCGKNLLFHLLDQQSILDHH
jgi:hypothetical protein